jgi:hypothetical protein
VLRRFEKEYGRRIPRKHYELNSDGNCKWDTNVRFSRESLKKYGFLNASTRGIWRITGEGLQWLKEHPHATHISGERRRTTPRTRRKTVLKVSSVADSGITLEMLEQTRKQMSANQFRQVWGKVYDRLLAEERAKTITEIDSAELGRRLRGWLDDVHNFLHGKITSTPSSEVLCDWIQFCYAMGLYREAAALLAYVHGSEVDPAIYKRARRVAEVCRSKLTG